MRRIKGYILTEIMMSMVLQAILISILGGAFYMLLRFSTTSEHVIASRNAGRYAMSYIEQRIIHAGLGLWGCKTPEDLSAKLSPLTASGRPLNGYTLPVNISVNLQGGGEGGTSGDILTVLYAEKDYNNNLIVTNTQNNKYTLISNDTGLTSADMAKDYGFSTDSKDIRAWFVTERKGLPALMGTPAEAGEELLHLRCERIYISGDKFVGETLTDTWSNKHVIQDGILDIFFELNTDKNVLDCYILSSGGIDGKSHTVPSTWPIHAKMKPGDSTEHILNISRASWKLRNITKEFFKQ